MGLDLVHLQALQFHTSPSTSSLRLPFLFFFVFLFFFSSSSSSSSFYCAMSGDDHLSRLVYELCKLLLTVLHYPDSALPPANPAPAAAAASTTHVAARRQGATAQMSPAGFASLLLGVSLALMLCGSVTFVIGFMLMPWVIGLVMLLYFVGMVSILSGFWRTILCPSSSPSSPKKLSGPLFTKLPII